MSAHTRLSEDGEFKETCRYHQQRKAEGNERFHSGFPS
jgi:hypothetical protein